MLSSWPAAPAQQATLPARALPRTRVPDGLQGATATAARSLNDVWARGLVVDALEPTAVLPMVRELYNVHWSEEVLHQDQP